MGNAQNAHLDRHGSRASSTSDVSSLGSNRHSRALDNVSLLSVDAVLTSYERRAFGELEAQAEADYSPPTAGSRSRSHTHPNPQVPPDPNLLSAGHQDRGRVSASSYSDSDHLSDVAEGSPYSPGPYSPGLDEEAARWQEWTSKSDDDGLSEDRDSIDDSDELDAVNTVDNNIEDTLTTGAKAVSMDMENNTETPMLHSDSMESCPQTSSSTEDVQNIQSSSDDVSTHREEPGVVKASDNKVDEAVANSGGNNTVDAALNDNSGSADDLEFSDTVEVQSDASVIQADCDPAMEVPIAPKAGTTGDNVEQHSDGNSDDSEDEVFSGSANDYTPVGTPLSRSRPVSIDDLLDCLQETAVDELELSARKKSAELGDAESISKSPTPPPILSPPPAGHMAMFSHLDDADMIVNAEDYPHLHEIARSEPRSEPVTDLDDDSDDDEFQQSFFKDLQSDDPAKSAARDEMSRILLEMQQQFGVDDDDSDEGSLEKERKVSRESVSSGGEYDTATMKVKRDVYSDSSDSSDDESTGSEDEEKKKVPETKYDSSSEDEIIQHITPELIDKVINADETMVDLFADAHDEPITQTQTEDEPLTPTQTENEPLSPTLTEDEPLTPTTTSKDEPEALNNEQVLIVPDADTSKQEQPLDGSTPEETAETLKVLVENSSQPDEVAKISASETSVEEPETGNLVLENVREKEELEASEKDQVESSEKDKVDGSEEDHVKPSEQPSSESTEKDTVEATEKEEVEASEKDLIESSEKEKRENAEMDLIEGMEKDSVVESSKKDIVETAEEDMVKTAEKDMVKTAEQVILDDSEETVTGKALSSVDVSDDIQATNDKAPDTDHEAPQELSTEQGPQPVAEKEDNVENDDAQMNNAKSELVHEAIVVEVIEPELSQNLEASIKADQSPDDQDKVKGEDEVDQVNNVPQETIPLVGESTDSVSQLDKTADVDDTVVAAPLIVVEAAAVEETSADNTANVIAEDSQVDGDVSESANISAKSSDDKTVVENVGEIPASDGASEAAAETAQDLTVAEKVEHVVESISLNQADDENDDDEDDDDIVVHIKDKTDQDESETKAKDPAADSEAPTVHNQHPPEPTVSEPCLNDDSDIETIRVLNTQVSDCAITESVINTESLPELTDVAPDDEIVKSAEAVPPESSPPTEAVVVVEAVRDEVAETKESSSKEEDGSAEVVVVAKLVEEPAVPEKVPEASEEKVSEAVEKEAEVVQETQIMSAEVTFKQEQFVFETISEDKDENSEKETKDKVVGEGSPVPSEVTAEAKPKKLDVIIEEDQTEVKTPETDKVVDAGDEDDSEPPPLPTSPPPNTVNAATLSENKEKPVSTLEQLPPAVPEYHGYSRQLLRVISKKYPFRPMPKEPEAQRYYRQMMRQIETEIHEMVHAPEDPTRSDATRASYRERKTSVPPPARLTMQTPVPPPPRTQTASRPPQHPAMIPTKSEPRKELSRKELKRRESETRKSKKLKKKDKENESRMAQFAQFMK